MFIIFCPIIFPPNKYSESALDIVARSKLTIQQNIINIIKTSLAHRRFRIGSTYLPTSGLVVIVKTVLYLTYTDVA